MSKIVAMLCLTAALALSACGGGGGSSSGDEAFDLSTLETSTPAGEGEIDSISWNLLREPVTLDPIKSQTESENPVVVTLCDTLLRMTPDFEVKPGLAKSFELVDPKTWVYELRDDATFWNGEPVTPEDVVFSLERSFGGDATSYWPLYFERVDSVQATGPTEVTIKLKKPYSMLNEQLSALGGAIVEKASVEAAGGRYGTPSKGVMCSGPFEFQRWNPGRDLTVVRNDDYWGEKPKVDQILFKFIEDESTLSSATSSGQIQGMYEVPVAALPQIQGSSEGALHLGPSTRMLSLVPTERPGGVLRDAKVRQALYLAMDHQAIASSVFANTAVPAKSVAPPTWGYSQEIFGTYYDSIPEPKVDMARAKQLVADAGASGKVIKLATDNSRAHVSVTNSIQSAASQIGLKVDIAVLTPTENEALFFDKKLRQGYDGFINSPFTFVADPLELGIYLLPDSYYNYGLYKNQRFASLIERALGEYDDDTRARTLVEAQRIMDRDVPWIPIVYQPVRMYQSNEIGGATPSWSYMSAPWTEQVGTAP